jgi:hypothetical protein
MTISSIESVKQMSLATSPDVLAAHLAGEAVLLNLNDKSYYRLNETAAVVWAAVERGDDRAAILASLLESYNVDADVAEREMNEVIDDMCTRKLLIHS